MKVPENEWFPLEVALTFTNLATGQRESRVVPGKQRRNPKLTPEEREKYVQFYRRRNAKPGTPPEQRKTA